MADTTSSTASRTLRERTLAHPERWFTAGTFLILLVAALKLASAFFLPVVASALIALLLAPPVRWLSRHRIPAGLAAALVISGVVVVVSASITSLARPAIKWLNDAPETLAEAQVKIQRLAAPLYNLQRTAATVQAATAGPTPAGTKQPTKVEVTSTGMLSKISGTTVGVFAAVATVLFLTFFLLAAGDRFSEQLGDIMPERYRRQMLAGLRDMQAQMSRYLATSVLIRVSLGIAVWGSLTLIGLPNAALWGVVAAVLNFIPYLGSFAALLIVGVAALVHFDTTGPVLYCIGAVFVIGVIEGNFVTPMLLGHRLPLNVVAIFLGLLFWGWIWGITGAVLAVPLTVLIKVFCDRVKPLEPLGVLLGS
jgi:predicted PurR-regulated permease PerM